MEPNNPNNNNNPFGNYNIPGTPTNVPRDITSDQWVPISSGATNQPPQNAHLTDRDLQPEPQEQKQPPRKKPSRKKAAQKKAAARKKAAQDQTRQHKKPQQQSSAQQDSEPSKQAQRPVVSGTHKDSRIAAELRRRSALREQQQQRRFEEAVDRQERAGMSRNEIRLNHRKKKLRGKRLLVVLTAGVILLLALIVTAVYCLTYGIPIKNITVEGSSIYSAEEIINASGILLGDNMLGVRQKRTNEVLCTALPYLAYVEVDYQTPDTLHLIVTANKERFLIATEKGFLCIDKNDKILSLKKKKVKDGQYRLLGFDAQEVKTGSVYAPTGDNKKRLALAKEIVEQVEGSGIKRANKIDLTDPLNIILCIDDRVNVYLGDANKIDKKMKLIAEVYSKNFSGKTTGYIDAKYKKGLFYKLGNMTNG